MVFAPLAELLARLDELAETVEALARAAFLEGVAHERGVDRLEDVDLELASVAREVAATAELAVTDLIDELVPSPPSPLCDALVGGE